MYNPKATKNYACVFCGQKIPKKTRYIMDTQTVVTDIGRTTVIFRYHDKCYWNIVNKKEKRMLSLDDTRIFVDKYLKQETQYDLCRQPSG